jgi:hypothetical protein
MEKKKPKIRSRDIHMVALIRGATKSYVEKDQKKQADKEKCREVLDREDEDL